MMVVSIVIITCGCKENQDVQADVQVAQTGHTSCKEFLRAGQMNDGYRAEQNSDCIEYHYDGQKTLTINHINAAFNCCPGDISANVNYTGNLITIVENETQSGCYCQCLYDVQYEVSNLPPGKYRIRFIEPYAATGDQPLDFTITLTTSSETVTKCVERSNYPWKP